jgi:GntR family carbon starvation induced transcriptional regulator
LINHRFLAMMPAMSELLRESPAAPSGENGAATLAAQLGERLREAILRGDYAPGEKLRLDRLRESYGVSLSPLREALSRLGAEGLVVAEHQRGYRVAPASLENLEEVTRLRIGLEGMALAEAMRRGDEEWEAGIVAAFHRLTRLEARIPKPDRIREWEVRHREFHLSLLSACGMPLLLQFCQTLHDLSDRYRRVYLAKYPLDRDVHGEHETIMRAAIARKERKALEALRQHIERTSANVRDVLSRKRTR